MIHVIQLAEVFRDSEIVCCIVIPFILDVRFVDAPAGVTQEEGHTGILHLPSAVLALIFIARKIQPSLSLVDCYVEFVYPPIDRSPLDGHFILSFLRL